MMQEIKNVWIIWIDTQEQIASFHSETGYEEMSFSSSDFFLSYVQSLQHMGYRFM